MGVGIIGCGNISAAYFRLAPLFKGLKVRACADINMDAAEGARQGIRRQAPRRSTTCSANDDVDVVVNLTIPEAHYAVSKQVLEAGKHVYSEKPFVLSVEGRARTSRSAPTTRA